MKMRPLLQTFHRWAGLTVGTVFAVLGLSGALLVFQDDIRDRLYPEVMHVAPVGEPAPPSRLIAGASQGGTVASLQYPSRPDRPVRARVMAPDGTRTDLLLNSATAEIIGPLPGSLFPVLFDLHAHLLSGPTGHTVVGALGLLLIATLVPGIVLWWPRPGQWRMAFTIKRGAGLRRRLLDLHKVGGAVLAIPLLVTAITGAVLVYRQSLAPLVVALGGEVMRPGATGPSLEESGPRRDFDAMLEEAQRRLPDGRVTAFVLPRKPGGPIQVRFALPGDPHPRGNSSVQFDNAGRVLAVRRGTDLPAANWAVDLLPYPVHTGDVFGLGGRLIMLVGGLALPTLWGTGLWLWLRARRRARTAVPAMATS